jgi:ATP-dependent Clp protease ATP-binding subunit ClpC
MFNLGDNSNKYIICPECEGRGKNKLGFSCKNCNGMGIGIFYRNTFLYWGLQIGRAVIEMNSLRKKFRFALNISAWLIAVAGLAALCLWIFETTQVAVEFSDFAFWEKKHYLISLFFASLFSIMFIIYLESEQKRRDHKIRPLKHLEEHKNFKTPNNWEELSSSSRDYKLDVLRGFDDNSFQVVEQAFLLASNMHHREVTPMHIFFSALSDKQVTAMFSRLNVRAEDLLEKIKKQLLKIEKDKDKIVLSNDAKKVLVEAYLQASELARKKVTPKNFLIPCFFYDKTLNDILYEMEIDEHKMHNVILWFIINEQLVESYRKYKSSARFKPSTNMDRAYTAVATKTLNNYAYDLTVSAKWGKLDYCVARDTEIEKIFQNFESGHHGVILVGQTGVGKNTIVNGIAQRMVQEDVPMFFQDKRLLELDVSRLVSGVTPAQAQGRMVTIIDEVRRAGNIVLFVRDIDNIIGITSGEEESMDLSEVLVGSIIRGDIFCIASARTDNYIKYIEGKSLGEVMVKVSINEPVGNQVIQIVESKISYFEGKYKVYFSYNAIERVIKMSKKYIHDKYLPEKAIEILELVAVRVAKEKGAQATVTKEDIAKVVGDITNIPVTKVTKDESKELLFLEQKIHRRMIGQYEAVDMVAASLRRARAELREGKRPIANFLFLGPTGVGKTELAKTVSDVYFGDEKYMIRIDMSEYQHPDSIKKMIGDAQGAIGYLTEKVRKTPFSLILLDEIEKAHGDILNLFLQVMDDGRLTDGQGRTIDFTNSIIIATSNAGALYIQEEVLKGTDIETIKRVLMNKHLNKVMRPELVNRFDGVIVFEPLSMENVVDIAKLMLASIGKMLETKGVKFQVDEKGVRVLAGLGYDPKFGARPLRRLLQEKIEDEIANLILSEELKRRDTLVINKKGGVEVIKRKEL